jgi:hypothetical protein
LTDLGGLFNLSKVRTFRSPSRRRVRAARWLAIAVDFLQIAVFPVFLAGAASPADDVVDVAAGAAMVALVGWHWAFLPSFVTKLLPVWDLVPTWTAAVFLATRGTRPDGQDAVETTLAQPSRKENR